MRDYNIMSHFGFTDQEYVEEFGVPQELAGTPEINDWMIEYTYKENYRATLEANIADGMESKKAEAEALKEAKRLKRDAIKNLRKITKLRVY